MWHAINNIADGAKAFGDLLWPSALVCRQAASNSGDVGQGVVASSKLRHATKHTILV